MKFYYAFLILFSSRLLSAQNDDHPTISQIKVIYKASPTSTVIVAGKPKINTTPEIKVLLKDANDVSEIYFEILKQDSSLVYKANYGTNSSAVYQNNKKVFDQNSNSIFLSCPQTIIKDIYIYKLYTKKNNQLSPYYYSKN